MSPIFNFHVGLFILRATIPYIFLHFSPFFSLSIPTFMRNSCSFLSVATINTVSAAYLMLLMFYLPIINRSRICNSLRITSLYNLYNPGEEDASLSYSAFYYCGFTEFVLYPYASVVLPAYFLDYSNTFTRRNNTYLAVLQRRIQNHRKAYTTLPSDHVFSYIKLA